MGAHSASSNSRDNSTTAMDNTSPSDRVKKTRNRIPTSCDHCRKRKLKCDRQKPCSNCVKSQTEDLCKYAVSTKASSGSSSNVPKINMNNEIIRLKLQINKLERILELNNIDINNYNNILPGVSDDSNDDSDDNSDDPMISLSNKFDAMIIKENKILHSGTTSYVTFIVRDKQLANIFEAYGKRHIMIYESYQQKQKVKASDFPVDISQNHLSWLTTNAATEVSACDLDNMENIQFGNFVNPPGAGITSMQAKLVLDVLKDVNTKLPPLFVVNVLVDHFFKYVYPLLPLVDEEIFREELSYVLVPTENGGCKVAITHLQNTSIVSLLLVILRYAYLAVNIKDYAEDNRAIGNDFLIAMIKSGFKIDSNYVVLAKSLLMALPAEDSIFKKVTLRNIQVLLYLRLYQVYSPEMHEESREHSLTLALIIQMCRSLGANRDPENFPHIFKDDREICVWRRIYYKLLTLDINNAFEYGCPLIISDDEYDIKLPSLNKEDTKILGDFKKGLSVSKSGDEIKKLVIENAINKDTALEYEAIKLIREGLTIFQNFKTSFKKSKLLKIVDQMQEFVDKKIPSLWEMLQDNTNANYMQLEKLFDIPKVRKFEIRLTVQTILMGFYYLLYLNEEDEHNAAMTNNSSPEDSDDDLDYEGEGQDSSVPFDFMRNKYGIRGMELALTVLKMNYDYTKYMTQSVTLDGDSKQYKALKYFSAKCDIFILNRIAMSFLRPFFFLCSTFMKNLYVKSSLTFDEVIKRFSNSIDSTVVLKWFNLNVALVKDSSKVNCEFSFLLFQYVKDLFFMNYNLKNEFFICWRNTMIIKLFINYFKSADKNLCSEFLHPNFAHEEGEGILGQQQKHDKSCEEDGVGSDGFIDTGFMDGVESTKSTGGVAKDAPDFDIPLSTGYTGDVGNGDSKLVQDFLDTAVPEDNLMNYENDGNNLDNLIYDDVDNMIDDIFRDSGVRQQMAQEFELFNVNQFSGGIGEIIGANTETTSEERSNFETKMNNMVSSKPSVSSIHTGSGGPFTGMTNSSDNSNLRTPDLSMFTDSPVDYTKGAMGGNSSVSGSGVNGDGTSSGNNGSGVTGIQDVINEMQNKGLFY